MRQALITGITGQVGSYLAEHLLDLGYEVHGVVRRASTINTSRIDHLYRDRHDTGVRLYLHYGDLADASSIARILREEVRPDEVYNLGAQSHVRVSFDMPEYTADVVATGALRLLEAVRDACPEAAVYQASSSEVFGSSPPSQSEVTPFHPRSPYAVSKAAGFWHAVNHREAYGMRVSNGILFNTESPRRSETFVTRKVTKAAARIKLGREDKLHLGNLDAMRDWGFAGDYVRAMRLMLERETPDDYVIATGESHSVRELVEVAFGLLGLDPAKHVEVDPRYLRPAEVDHLRGDAAKARRVLGWEPTVRFRELVEMMVKADYDAEKSR